MSTWLVAALSAQERMNNFLAITLDIREMLYRAQFEVHWWQILPPADDPHDGACWCSGCGGLL